MNLNLIKQAVTQTVGRGFLITKKHSPIVLTAVGVVGVVATVIMSSKATLKLDPIVEDAKDHLALSHERRESGIFSEKDYAKDVAFIYGRASVDVIKLYGPSVTVGVASLVCLISAQGIMQKRNAALTTAYAAVEQGFAEYRKRVADKIGVDEEKALRYGLVTEERTDEETGEKSIIQMLDSNQLSPYVKFFDPTNQNWSKNPEYNKLFLMQTQNYMNNKLHAQGWLLLNDVYDALAIPRTKAGCVVGWTIGKQGDNFVDFGMYKPTPAHADFVNGQEDSILLDFNVDGVVYGILG